MPSEASTLTSLRYYSRNSLCRIHRHSRELRSKRWHSFELGIRGGIRFQVLVPLHHFHLPDLSPPERSPPTYLAHTHLDQRISSVESPRELWGSASLLPDPPLPCLFPSFHTCRTDNVVRPLPPPISALIHTHPSRDGTACGARCRFDSSRALEFSQNSQDFPFRPQEISCHLPPPFLRSLPPRDPWEGWGCGCDWIGGISVDWGGWSCV
mmetsp:Transcript_1445/g.2053  ORF Transcript_1445/g.2053 Transcript_1445/m.2053 type:complete len:210 (-) Transcript_1445:216-845(-)